MIDVRAALREAKYDGETDAEFLVRVGIPSSTYYRLLKGKTPSLRTYAQLVKAGVIKQPGKSLARSVES
jgi:predicted transcriptional regulator